MPEHDDFLKFLKFPVLLCCTEECLKGVMSRLTFNPLYPLFTGLSGPVLPLSSCSWSCGSLLIRDSKACLTPGPIQTHRVRQRCLILLCTATPPPPSDPVPHGTPPTAATSWPQSDCGPVYCLGLERGLRLGSDWGDPACLVWTKLWVPTPLKAQTLSFSP